MGGVYLTQSSGKEADGRLECLSCISAAEATGKALLSLTAGPQLVLWGLCPAHGRPRPILPLLHKGIPPELRLGQQGSPARDAQRRLPGAPSLPRRSPRSPPSPPLLPPPPAAAGAALSSACLPPTPRQTSLPPPSPATSPSHPAAGAGSAPLGLLRASARLTRDGGELLD